MRRRARPALDAPELHLLDPAEGAWVAGMLEAGIARAGGGLGDVAATVPVGDPVPYAAIARILHPVPWHRQDSAGPAHGTTTWRHVAADHGTELHAAAQWADLARVEAEGRSVSPRDPALEYDPPQLGSLPPPTMDVLAEVLLRHTGTPSDLVLGLWPGFGWMDGGSAVFGPGVAEATGGRHSSLTMPPAFGPRTTGAMRRGTGLLEVGGIREYLLVADDGTRLRHPEWGRVGHPVLPETEGAEYQSPNLAWPRDRAWALASEIDHDSTLVAGSTELVRAICTHPDLEAVVVRPDTALTSFADTVNHADPDG